MSRAAADRDERDAAAADLALIARAARAAGAAAMPWFGALKPADIHAKLGDEPVTEADFAANAVLQDMLLTARPDYGWLSEETPDDPARLGREHVFVVDPIDGTRAFIAGQSDFVVSVAVTRAGRPVAGALYRPVKDQLYTAHLGGGAHLDGAPLRVRDRAGLAGARLVTPRRNLSGPAWPVPWPEMYVTYRNSMAYRMAIVARGDWHGTLALTPKSDWDIAAADIIAAEAGGIVTGLDGEPFRYNQKSARKPGVVCAGPDFHAALMRKIAERRQDDNG